jgi:hypothetical protein
MAGSEWVCVHVAALLTHGAGQTIGKGMHGVTRLFEMLARLLTVAWPTSIALPSMQHHQIGML